MKNRTEGRAVDRLNKGLQNILVNGQPREGILQKNIGKQNILGF